MACDKKVNRAFEHQVMRFNSDDKRKLRLRKVNIEDIRRVFQSIGTTCDHRQIEEIERWNLSTLGARS